MPSIARPTSWWTYRTAMFEDSSDRLNHVWTFALLLFFAVMIAFKQTVNSPVSCWLTETIKDENRQFVNDLCWNSHVIVFSQDNNDVSSLYSDVTDDVPYPRVRSTPPDKTNYLTDEVTTTLYQWIPVILVFQALLFKSPHLFLYMFHGYSGLNFDKLVALTRGYDRLNIAERRVLGNQIGRYLYYWSDQFGHCIPWRFLTLIYIITKFLYCVNVIVQICLLDSLLRTPETVNSNITSFSDVIVDNIFKMDSTAWKSSPAFPRIVLCEYESPSPDNIQFNVRCFLTMNVYNEMVYVIVWTWFLFLSTVTCMSLVSCLVKISIAFFRKRYIQKFLSIGDNKDDSLHEDPEFSKFVDWLGEDGVIALKLIGANSSEVLISDVICSMWKKRKRHKASNKAGYIDMTPGGHSPPPRIKIHPVVTDMEH